MSSKKKRNRHKKPQTSFNELPDHPNDFPGTTASIQELSKETGYTPQETRAALRQLKQLGFIDTPTIPRVNNKPTPFTVFLTPTQAAWWQSLKTRALAKLFPKE